MKSFNEDLNVAVFTTRYVLREGESILNVFHHEDGAWEFTCGTECEDDKDYLIVSLEEIINIDPSVLQVADLPLGESAYRSSREMPWQRH